MAAEKKQKSFTTILIYLRPVLRWLFKLRGSPKAVAGGLSLGMFIALTPTIGLQIIIAVLLATILNLNRPAAILAVWITNPFSIPVIFTFNYWVGTLIISGPPVLDVAKRLLEFVKQIASFNFWEMIGPFTAIMQLGREVLYPLAIGSIIVGSCMAGLTYYLSLKLLEAYMVRRERKRRQRKELSANKHHSGKVHF